MEETKKLAAELHVRVKQTKTRGRIAQFSVTCPDEECGTRPWNERTKRAGIKAAQLHIIHEHRGAGRVVAA